MGQNWRGGSSESDKLPTGPTCGGGFVYLVAKRVEGPTKIGVSRQPRKRVKSLETSLGERFNYIWSSVECLNSAEIEAAMLNLLRRHRTIGEWLDVPFAMLVARAQQARYIEPDYATQAEQLAEAANRIMPPINHRRYPRV